MKTTQTEFGGLASEMNLRDYFAAQALVAWVYARTKQGVDITRDEMANDCYHYADAMISARNRKPTNP